MKIIFLIPVSLLVLSCATAGTNIPDIHENICPGITDDSPSERESAVFHCKDRHVLFDVAKYDKDVSIRVDSAKRLMDIKMIIELYEYVKTDDTLSKSQRKKFRSYLKKKFKLLKKCPGVGYTDVKRRKNAIYKCDSDLLKVFVAKYDFDDNVRIYASGNIMSTNLLKKLWSYIKSDKTISVKMKKRFQKTVIRRAKALDRMRMSAGEKSVSNSNYSSGKQSAIAYDATGMPIERKVTYYTKENKDDKEKKNKKNDDYIFSDKDADKVSKMAERQVKTCYEQTLKRYPSVKGRIRLFVKVGKNGKVKKVIIKEDEPQMFSMTMCIRKRVKQIKPKGVTGPGSIEWTIMLTNGY